MYLSKVPLRIGLAGGGTDIAPYCFDFGGAVLNATIDKYVYVKLTPVTGDVSTFIIKEGKIEHVVNIRLKENNAFPRGVELICATCEYFLIQKYRIEQSFILEITLDEDQGGGLGTSSAMVVAIVASLYGYLKLEINPQEIAKAAFHIEREIMNYAGGKQDQYSAAFGGFNFLKFEGNDVFVESLNIDETIREKLASNLLLYNTGKMRVSGEIIRDQQKNVLNKKSQSLESLHFIKQQAYDLRSLLEKGDIDRLGDVLHEGWLHKKSTSDKISTSELDIIYESALKVGATGGKVLGAGGGGYMLFYCPTELQKNRVTEELLTFGGSVIPLNFTSEGVSITTCD